MVDSSNYENRPLKKADNKYIKALKKDWIIYLLAVGMVIWFLVFAYKPMLGLLIAFRKYDAKLGVLGSEHNGLFWFRELFFGSRSAEFSRAFGNTFLISTYSLVFGFPIPILIAIFFSEIGNEVYRRVTQTLAYLPHFLSEVTITSLLLSLIYVGTLRNDGILVNFLVDLKIIAKGTNIIKVPGYFKPLFIMTGIWKEAGYSSIVYFAAIVGISPHLYEAAKVDGATKLQQIRYVTFPGMAPTLSIMIILRIGNILSVGYERIILLYTPETYSTADTISSFVFRVGLGGGAGGGLSDLAAAADLINAVISFVLVIGANYISKQFSETSLF